MSPEASPPPLGLPFTAYRQAPVRRWLRLGLLFAAALVALGGWFTARRAPTAHTLATHRGIQTLIEGMTREEVERRLGSPRSQSTARACSFYGSPSFAAEGFTLFEVCYATEKMVGVTERHFNATPVELWVFDRSDCGVEAGCDRWAP